MPFCSFYSFELLMIKDLSELCNPWNYSHCRSIISQSYLYKPTQFMSFRSRFSPQTIKVLIWGGMGGVSIALAMSIPKNEYSTAILSITYLLWYSLLLQGLTIGKVANPKKIANEEMEQEHISE
jgi:CPA1 family monovalent cation:H+ antiporter